MNPGKFKARSVLTDRRVDHYVDARLTCASPGTTVRKNSPMYNMAVPTNTTTGYVGNTPSVITRRSTSGDNLVAYADRADTGA